MISSVGLRRNDVLKLFFEFECAADRANVSPNCIETSLGNDLIKDTC